MESNSSVPILFPLDPEKFWEQLRMIIREEVDKAEKKKRPVSSDFETPGLTQKPLYKLGEVCKLFDISRPTVYDWIKHGKLRPFKIRSRVYFLWNDIQQLLENKSA